MSFNNRVGFYNNKRVATVMSLSSGRVMDIERVVEWTDLFTGLT